MVCLALGALLFLSVGGAAEGTLGAPSRTHLRCLESHPHVLASLSLELLLRKPNDILFSLSPVRSHSVPRARVSPTGRELCARCTYCTFPFSDPESLTLHHHTL